MLKAVVFQLAICLVGGPVFTVSPRANGQEYVTHSRKVENGRKGDVFRWQDILGQQVVVEGVAWCDADPWGNYVILDGARVYVDFKAGEKMLVPSVVDPNRSVLMETESLHSQGFRKSSGLSVRVTGTLANQRIKAATRGTPGPSQDVVIYRIQNATWERLDRIEWP